MDREAWRAAIHGVAKSWIIQEVTGGPSRESRALHVAAVADMSAATGVCSHNRELVGGDLFFFVGIPWWLSW